MPASKHRLIFRLDARLPYRVTREANWYVARCELLRVTTQGRTERSALKNLKDAIALKIQIGLEQGTLQETLAGYGFHPVRVGDRTLWGAAKPEGSASQVRLRARLPVRGKPRELPVVTKESIPNILPWTIDGHFSETPSGRARAA